VNVLTLLTDALNALKRNLSLVLVFFAAAIFLSVAHKILILALGLDGEGLAPALGLLRIAVSVTVIAAYSLLLAVLFARLARAMDRPIWKCSGDREALRLYFEPWFILSLIHFALLSLAGTAHGAGQPDLAATIILLTCLYALLIIPAGACIMYAHGLNWQNLGDILAPIGRQFGQVLIVILIGFLQVILFIGGSQLVSAEGPTLDPRILLVEVTINGLDLLAFAVMWRILMIDRDTPREDSDYFDF
jgi:hypothetical protein